MTDWAGFTVATKRNPARRTLGGRIAKVARIIGKPGMPWQREVWDVATELDAAGNLVYEIVLVTVPRQSGKTTAYGPVQLDRVMMMPGVKTFYTAQTGKDARSRFNDLVALVQESPLDMVARYRYSAGDEAISFPNGSALKIFAPVLAALHGETPPLVGMDEIWELDEALGDALLEGAIIPAQLTLAGRRQVWLFSTAGTAESRFMKKWVDRGREAVATGGRAHPKLAYFEASLREGDDPYDPEAIARFHPAVGHTVTAEELLEIASQVSHGTWLRAFCNLWTETTDPVIDAGEWAELVGKPAVPSRRELAITYEIGVDSDGGERGEIVASWFDDASRPHTRVIHSAPGTSWMLGLLLELARTWRPKVLGADDAGATRRLTDRLRHELGDEAVTTTGAKDYGTACGTWLYHVLELADLTHDGSETFAHNVAHLALKVVNGVTMFDRTKSTGSVAGISAAAVGLWLHSHGEQLEKPEIYS